MPALSESEMAETYVALLLRDPHADETVRALAKRLRPVIDDDPVTVVEQLRRASAACVYPLHEPDRDLAKVVSLDTYWSHYLDAVKQAYFTDSVGYGRYIAARPDPGQQLLADLRRSPALIQRERTWLAPADDILRHTGKELPRVLELGAHVRPPLVVLVLALDRQVALGVRVRRPTATDAVAGEYVQWRPTGLASGVAEWIDHTIPADAVTSVEWKP
jgi:hypothetical protein